MAKPKKPRKPKNSKRSNGHRPKLCGLECHFTAGYHQAQVAVMALSGIPEQIRGRLNMRLIQAYSVKHPH